MRTNSKTFGTPMMYEPYDKSVKWTHYFPDQAPVKEAPKEKIFIPDKSWLVVAHVVLQTPFARERLTRVGIQDVFATPLKLTHCFGYSKTAFEIRSLKSSYNLTDVPDFSDHDFYVWADLGPSQISEHNKVTKLLRHIEWILKNNLQPSLEIFK